MNLVGETDEPVTTDIKRLIRVPGSLHGKTGLRVTAIAIDELDEFDPLVHAVALPDDPVEVKVIKENYNIPMGGSEYDLENGSTSVPRYLAYFLLARGIAVL